jgi:hypothetical protein
VIGPGMVATELRQHITIRGEGPAGGRAQHHAPPRRGYRYCHCLCCHPARTRQHQ